MPPKRRFDDDDDDRTTESTETEESDDSDASTTPQKRVQAVDTSSGQVGGQTITNNPHDMAFEVEDDTDHKTPPEGSLHGSGATKPSAIGGAGAATAGAPGGGSTLMNNPNDLAFEVEGARNVPTPQAGGADSATGRVGAPAPAAAANSGSNKIIKNDKHDEFSDVEDDEEEEDADTPPRSSQPNRGPNAPNNANKQPAVAGGNTISNDHHDEGFEVEGSSAATTPERNQNGNTSNSNNSGAASNANKQPQHTPANAASSKGPANGQMRPDDDEDEDSSDVETSEDDDDDVNHSGGAPVMGAIEAAAQQQQAGALEYNPKDYEYLRKKVPADVLELFSLIDGFQATEMDLPAKFRPFVPEFIPCVGDLDAFCKVPRPDGLPDGFGLQVIDEPSTYQSNPAVIKIWLDNLTIGPGGRNENVTQINDAHVRPGLIDRWVTEIKELHTKKALPSVNYSKPMPDIEELLQIWPSEFEEVLSSDLQFPPPQIDLDIEQHCRVMCAMLDIPVYDNIIESLHVMFSLFVEFRANQHFQHN